MNLPTIIILPRQSRCVHAAITQWLEDRDILKDTSFNWLTREFAFEHEEDATAFIITFGGKVVETHIQKMVREIDA